jgi:hypothetical protein
MAYRQPDREALEELDGHQDRVAAILARADAEEARLTRRSRGLRWAALGLAGAAGVGFLAVVASQVGWPVFLFAGIFAFIVIGAAVMAKDVPPREGGGGPPVAGV